MRVSRLSASAAALVAGGLSCALSCAPPGAHSGDAALDSLAVAYVHLGLAMEPHDTDYVDAYFGPPEWCAAARRDTLPLAALRARADSLIAALAAVRPSPDDSLATLRVRLLRGQLMALAGRACMGLGERPAFDQESAMLYGAVAPAIADSAFAPVLARLDSLLPGNGSLADRYDRFRLAFIVPPARVDAVFRAAIEEARRRTRAHVSLPDSESFRIEYVRDQPWSGYNWYQGGYRSLIQINVDLPTHIDRALDLACHEGYPGHHVACVLMEQQLLRGRGWIEFSLLPLYSPLSLVGEGAANVAPDIAFPAADRHRFEKEVLFPLAGIDPALHERCERMRQTLEGLELARIQGARRYLDGEISRAQVVRWYTEYALLTPERAERAARFDDRYRSYAINYGLGAALVREWLRARGGDASNPARQWALFEELLVAPKLPEDLRAAP
jgi:hypothetical protein